MWDLQPISAQGILVAFPPLPLGFLSCRLCHMSSTELGRLSRSRASCCSSRLAPRVHVETTMCGPAQQSPNSTPGLVLLVPPLPSLCHLPDQACQGLKIGHRQNNPPPPPPPILAHPSTNPKP